MLVPCQDAKGFGEDETNAAYPVLHPDLRACNLPDRHPDLPGLLVVGAAVGVANQLEAAGGAAGAANRSCGTERV